MKKFLPRLLVSNIVWLFLVTEESCVVIALSPHFPQMNITAQAMCGLTSPGFVLFWVWRISQLSRPSNPPPPPMTLQERTGEVNKSCSWSKPLYIEKRQATLKTIFKCVHPHPLYASVPTFCNNMYLAIIWLIITLLTQFYLQSTTG